MLTIHHLGISQSERVLWLLEELNLDYKLIKHERDPILAPESLKVPGNETGKSPFIEDDANGVKLGESSAIFDYIIQKYGGGRLALTPENEHFADYLYWFHFANSTLQAEMVTAMFIDAADLSPDVMIRQFSSQRINAALQNMDDRLKSSKWLAGDDFTAADVISVYSVTTQRWFGPQVSLAPFSSLLRWVQDCAARPAYQRAMEKGDPDMKLLLGAEPPSVGMLAAGGVDSTHWRK